VVSREDGKEKVVQLHAAFFETRAVTGQVIGKVFDEIAEIVARVLERTGCRIGWSYRKQERDVAESQMPLRNRLTHGTIGNQ
jgi:hypothetical protein